MSRSSQADPRQIVAQGYDRIAERYAQWTSHEVVDDVRPRYTTLLLERVPQGAQVLELGCGGGGPTSVQLAERFALTGVDISARQIELARQHLPHATFLHADMTQVDFAPASFDAVAAFYAFLHLPHGELPMLLQKIGQWLRPGGLLVATMAAGADTGTVAPNFLGAPMYFSGYSIEDNRRFLEEAGLRVMSLTEERIFENGLPVGFLWSVAQKPHGTQDPDEARTHTFPSNAPEPNPDARNARVEIRSVNALTEEDREWIATYERLVDWRRGVPDPGYAYAPMPWRVLVQVGHTLVAHAGVSERTVTVGTQQIRVGSLGGLFTAPAWEQHGLGSLAMQTALGFICDDRSLPFGFLTCLEHMVPFYASRGWQRIAAPVAFQQQSGAVISLSTPYHAMVYSCAGPSWPDGPVHLNGLLM